MQLPNPDLEISGYKLYSMNHYLFIAIKQGLIKLDMRTASAVYWGPKYDYYLNPTGEYEVTLHQAEYRWLAQNKTDALAIFNFIQSLMFKGASNDLTLV